MMCRLILVPKQENRESSYMNHSDLISNYSENLFHSLSVSFLWGCQSSESLLPNAFDVSVNTEIGMYSS